MSDLDTFRDMQAMREQLSAAKSARRRRRHQLQQDTAETEVDAAAPEDSETSAASAEEDGFDLNAELEEFRGHAEAFLKDLEEGLDDVPTSTALGIFALGVLVGRLSR